MWRVLCTAALLGGLAATPLVALGTTLVSQAHNGPVPWDFADGSSALPFVTADGQAAVFTSLASNLIPGQQSNPFSKPYRWTAATDEVSPIGVEPNAHITILSMSPDGQWVGLLSHATNLISGAAERTPLGPPYPAQPYLLNTNTGEYVQLSSRATHVLVSDDGSRVALSTLNSRWNTNHVVIHDLANDTITDITPDANQRSFPVEFTSDGAELVFISGASNLAEPPTPIGHLQVYLHNFATQTNELLARDGRIQDADLIGGSSKLVFTSRSTDLVTGETATTALGVRAVEFDRTTGTYSYMLPPDVSPISNVDVSADGRWVSFVTSKSLATEDTNSEDDVYLLDRSTGAVRPVTAGALQYERDQRPTTLMSADGSVVALAVSGNSYLYSVAAAQLNKISSINGNPVAFSSNGLSVSPQISNDGQLVTFYSTATNLTAHDDDDGGASDLFIYRRDEARVELVADLLLTQERVRSYVFTSSQSVVYRLDNGELRLLDTSTGSDQLIFQLDSSYIYNVSSNGRYVAVATGSNFVLIDTADFSEQVLTSLSFALGQLLISGDGNVVLFSTTSQNLIDDYPNPSYRRSEFFSWDRTSNQIEILVEGGLDPIAAGRPWLSFDGRYVVFSSDACYQYDRQIKAVTRVFTTRQSHCGSPELSQDRRFMVFSSPANDLVTEGNVLDQEQLYVYDFLDDAVALLTPHGELEPRLARSFSPEISADGSTIAFASSLESLAPDGNNLDDIFVVDNPFLASPPDTSPPDNSPPENESLSFTATLRENSRIVDLQATWPADAQFTQVREVDVPGGVLWEGQALSWTGEYAIPASADQVTFISRYFIDGVALGTTSIEIQIEIEITGPESPETEPPVTEPPASNTSPVANPRSVSTHVTTPLSIVLTGSDAEGDSLSFAVVSLPANGGLSGIAPNLMYTPVSGFVGSDSFTFTVSDGQNTSAPVTVSIEVTEAIDEMVNLLSAVLPASRSVEVGTTATAFATLINAGTVTAQRCYVQLPPGVPANFFYQTSDSGTNTAVGSPNLPVDIPAGAAQSFVFGIIPTEEMPATEVALEFKCANATDAASFVGLNTLLLSAASTPVPDLIALAATTSNNGVMELNNNNGFFTAATINVGAAAAITVSADTGEATLPMALSLCQTDPLTSVCINPAVPSAEPVVVNIAEGGTPTFAVFANSSDFIALDPANSRVYLRFRDELGVVRGATSVAMQSLQ